MPETTQTNGAAIASLVLGLVGILACAPCAFFGLWFGISARRQIFLSGGQEQGEKLAIAGIWLSVTTLVIWSLSLLCLVTCSMLAAGG
jgi:hypothetical protein